jgi:hypothetical protein
MTMIRQGTMAYVVLKFYVEKQDYLVYTIVSHQQGVRIGTNLL